MNTPVREGETIEGSRTMRNRPYPVLKCSRSVTPPSPPTSPSETTERGDDTASAACTSILGALGVQSATAHPIYRVCYDPPARRDDRGVPYTMCGIDPVPVQQCNSAVHAPPLYLARQLCAPCMWSGAGGCADGGPTRQRENEAHRRQRARAENSIQPVQKKNFSAKSLALED